MNDVVISISTEQEVSDTSWRAMSNDGVLLRARSRHFRITFLPAISYVDIYLPLFTYLLPADVYLTMDDGLDGAMDDMVDE